MSSFDGADFLADFFDEADDLLQSTVSLLLALEGAPGVADEARLNDLFRVIHTLKGLCGMVGLRSGAELSHAMESLLENVRQARRPLHTHELDALFDGARLATAAVETLRNPQAKAPDVEALVARLADAGAAPSPDAPAGTSPASEDTDALPAVLRGIIPATAWETARNAARAAGEPLWLVTFTPSHERQQRGIDVNAVRRRLSERGRLLESRPLMREGQVNFVFIVESGAPDADDRADLQWDEIEVSAPAAPLAASPTPTPTLRVDLGTVDELMRQVGDLVMQRSRLQEEAERVERRSGLPILDVCSQMERTLRRLRETVMRVRLVPLHDLFSRLPLAVRDQARLTERRVKLEMSGQETLADKSIVDRLLDPLMHLVRNAVVHGLESPADRQARRKPAEGRVSLRARSEGDGVVVEVEDDGRGLQTSTIIERGRQLGLTPPGDDEGLLELLCHPGFSTRSHADMGAGRGVGLDVVRQAVQACGGTLSVSSRPGQGTTFTLRLPQTLTIIDVFVVYAGGHRYAVPRSAVDAVLRFEQIEVRRVGGGELMAYRDAPLPLLRLSHLLGVAEGPPPPTQHAMLVRAGTSTVGLVVDRIQGLRDVVVRAVTDPLIRQPAVGGVTDTVGGSATLILDVPGVVGLARRIQGVPS